MLDQIFLFRTLSQYSCQQFSGGIQLVIARTNYRLDLLLAVAPVNDILNIVESS